MRRGHTKPLSIALLCALIAGCTTLPGPKEMSDDGLERMPSRASGGVFRAPGAPFDHYRRLIVEPLTIEFRKGWRRDHKDVSDHEIQRMRTEARRNFRAQFVAVLVDEGPYTFADDAGADVLHVSPSVTDLDVPGPEVDSTAMRTLAPRSVALRITGELRDAATGRLVGRVDMFAGGEDYGAGSGQLRPTTRVSNAHEMRVAFRQWSQLLREALDVAKVERPRAVTAPGGENGEVPGQ